MSSALTTTKLERMCTNVDNLSFNRPHKAYTVTLQTVCMRNPRAASVQVKYIFLAVVAVLVITASSPVLASNATERLPYSEQDENTTNEIDPAVLIGTAPAEYSNTSELVAHSSYQDCPATVARGDWLAIKSTATASNTTAAKPLPGKNLLYADPATPGANSTHTMAMQIDHTIDDANSIVLNYGLYLRPEIRYGLGSSNIDHIGIDTDRNGMIETHLDGHVRDISVPGPKSIQITLNNSPTIKSGSYVIIRYSGIRNPPHERNGNVTVSLSGNRTATETGTVVYDSEYSGMFGGQTNLAVREAEPNSTPVLTLRSARVSLTDSERTVFLPTRGYEVGSVYAVSFDSVEKAYILPRSARVFANLRRTNKSVNISGFTTIAPDSSIGIYVNSSGSTSYGIYKRTTVDTNSFWSVKLKFPYEEFLDKDISIRVYDRSGVLLGSSDIG